MTANTWKNFERIIAAFTGGRRVPVTGRQRGDAPDIEHKTLSIECKYRRDGLPKWIRDAVHQAEASAQHGQLPFVVLGDNSKRASEALAVIKLGDLWANVGAIVEAIEESRQVKTR